jgi:WD40 repeat protein
MALGSWTDTTPGEKPANGVLAGEGVRVVLVGTGSHIAGSRLPELPTVAATVTDLASSLEQCCGADAERVRVVRDPADPLSLGRALSEAAEQARDALLVGYVGHGLVDSAGELYLATQATDDPRDGLGFKAFPYRTLRAVLNQSRARRVLVVLDCCFSGQATGVPAPAVLDTLATARPAVSYLLVSAASEEVALAPPGEAHTAFSGELIRVLREGDPAGPPELSLDHLYRCLDRNLQARGRPRPHPYPVGPAGDLVLAPNPAYQPPAPLHPPAVRAGGVCPYKGLDAYQVGDAKYFFGRDELTAQLAARLAAQLAGRGVLVVIGPSGAGKSSLLRAGLIPAIEESGLPGVPGSNRWPQMILTPGARPLRRLAGQLAPLTGQITDTVHARLAEDPAALTTVAAAVVSRHARGEPTTGRRLVLVVDQFEEVFTACEDESERRAFVDALSTAAESSALVVLGLRADFYARCAGEPRLVEPLQNSQLIVTAMNANQLQAAIEQPARTGGLQLEPGLTDRILHDLGADDRDDHAGGSLPFLSHALFETWRRREGERLTLAGYQATGAIWEAVAHSAEQRYNELSATEKATARAILLRLVHLGEASGEDTRRHVRRTELPHTRDAQRVLDLFADARLISLGTDTVEITHEALLRAWPTLRGWIDNDRAGYLTRQHLEQTATTWQREGHDRAHLYRGTQLRTAHDWATTTEHRDQLSPTAKRFLAASSRLRRAALMALAALSLLIVAAAAFAFQQAAAARAQRDNAISNQITTQAQRFNATDASLQNVSLSAQLYLTAHDLHPTPDLDTALITTAHTPLSTPLTGHTSPVYSVAFSPDGHTLASASDDHTVRLWNLTDPAHPTPLGPPLTDHTSPVYSVAFSPDGHTLASASDDGTVRLWNLTDPAHPTPLGPPLTGHTSPVVSVAFSPDGHTLASASYDRTVRLWKLTDPAHPTPLGPPLTGHTDWVVSVAFSPDGHTLASASYDRTVRLWNLADPAHPTPLGPPLAGHTNSVYSVVFSPGGRTLASASADRTVRLWNLADPADPTALGEPLTGHTDSVVSVAFSPGGRTLASASADGTVRLWNIPSGQLTGHTDIVYSVAFSPDGHTLASASDDRTVRLWNLTDPAHPTPLGPPLTGHTDPVVSVAFSPDGHTLASASWDRTVRLWKLTDPAHPTPLGPPLTDHTSLVSSVAFSPDGHTLASASYDRTVRLWNLSDPAHPTALGQPLTGHTSPVSSVAFSPDGHTLASASADHTVRLWNLTDSTHPTPLGPPLTDHTNPVNSVAFSPDGHTLASASDDRTVRLWNLTDSTHPTPLGPPLTGHTNTVNSVAFNPDGHTLASASVDGTVRLWNLSDPAHPTPLGQPLTGHTNSVYSVVFSPDGHTLASASYDHTVRLWDIDLDHAIQHICATTRNNLTPDAWQRYVSTDTPYQPHCP